MDVLGGSVLCVSCPFFSDALSGDWKESRHATAQDVHPRQKRLRSTDEGHGKGTETSASVPSTNRILGTIEMQDESAVVIRDFLCFMYRNLKLQLHMGNWLDLTKLADKVGMPELVTVCLKYGQGKVADMPLEVFQWSLTTGNKAGLFEKSSQILVGNLPAYKIQAKYVELPVQVRLLVSVVLHAQIHEERS